MPPKSDKKRHIIHIYCNRMDRRLSTVYSQKTSILSEFLDRFAGYPSAGSRAGDLGKNFNAAFNCVRRFTHVKKIFLTIFEKVLKKRAGYDIIIINIYASVYKSHISAEMNKFTRTF